MQLVTIDWIILAGSLLVIFLPALFFARRANRGTTEFFASGRAAPWWLVGTSMVATTFATDTPGLVTQLVRESGIAGNWVWWAFLLTGMATVFFYARLWRRAELLTDLEFYEIRYAGKPAAFVRCFRAVYLGLVFNCFIMATVTLAAVKIAGILFGVPAWQTIVGAIVLCSLVSAVSGLWGVLVSDLIQFGFAMTGSFAAAYYALRHPAVDGVAGLLARVDPAKLTLLPDFGNTANAVAVFILPLTVLWWSRLVPRIRAGRRQLCGPAHPRLAQ
jgi:SSS family solute:Na+ symporter